MGAILLALLGLAVLVHFGFFGEHWRGVAKRALAPAIIAGGIGFVAGFFGPMILAPDANQGPLLGIFITGPGGFLLGLCYGIVREVVRRDSPA
jgi:hypothetical protein